MPPLRGRQNSLTQLLLLSACVPVQMIFAVKWLRFVFIGLYAGNFGLLICFNAIFILRLGAVIEF